ncbi:MAG: prenyltransferase [Candidatus Thiodiazotropha sp. (ex Cardiolucina cf. quadrata)]|nr:prenyltransferase [Candidatus Thiodiazotropha sp. (ex Cardiolucina cf. quadrata)]
MIPFPMVGVARPSFLILTPICISLGLASVLLAGHDVEWNLLAVVLLGALMAHISVNTLNEYADFQSGLDFKTDRTPFSGGSGTLIIQPRLAPYALVIGIASLVITLVCGLYLLQRTGWGLIPIGIVGMLIIISYTTWINRHRLLVLITPGLSFGPLMVVGTHYALTGVYSPIAFLLSLIPFFLVNNLLLLNQIPDVDADRSVGRDNFVIAWSPAKSAWIFLGFGVMTYLVIIIGVLVGSLPLTALLGLLTAGFTIQIFNGVSDYQGIIEELVPQLGKNVLVTLVTPFLVFIGIMVDIAL